MASSSGVDPTKRALLRGTIRAVQSRICRGRTVRFVVTSGPGEPVRQVLLSKLPAYERRHAFNAAHFDARGLLRPVTLRNGDADLRDAIGPKSATTPDAFVRRSRPRSPAKVPRANRAPTGSRSKSSPVRTRTHLSSTLSMSPSTSASASFRRPRLRTSPSRAIEPDEKTDDVKRTPQEVAICSDAERRAFLPAYAGEYLASIRDIGPLTIRGVRFAEYDVASEHDDNGKLAQFALVMWDEKRHNRWPMLHLFASEERRDCYWSTLSKCFPSLFVQRMILRVPVRLDVASIERIPREQSMLGDVVERLRRR